MNSDETIAGLQLYLETCWDYVPEESAKTAERVIRFAQEWKNIREHEPKLYFEANFVADEMVIIKGISYASMCEHHMLPFMGTCSIAYFPSEKGVLGVSKFARVVNYFASRPQLQERLTMQIGEYLVENLETEDIAVFMNGVHTCAKIRGVQEPNMVFDTQFVAGKFRDNASTRQEFLATIQR